MNLPKTQSNLRKKTMVSLQYLTVNYVYHKYNINHATVTPPPQKKRTLGKDKKSKGEKVFIKHQNEVGKSFRKWEEER